MEETIFRYIDRPFIPPEVGVESAFHSLFYMVDLPEGKTVGIKYIAELNALSETYLPKTFARLRKGGLFGQYLVLKMVMSEQNQLKIFHFGTLLGPP